MSFTKILPADLNSRGATTLPNQPTISSTALKQEFDAPAKEVVAPKFNNLITELEATTAAADIGGVAPTGRTGSKIQTILNSISSDLATAETAISSMAADEHTHANKALLDTYTQTESDLASAVADDHTHSNKSLLDTYTQTEANIADAVSKKHAHSNKALLDTYTQTETDLADAVSKKHSHSNKSLLDTYTQTEANLADAVTKKHTHTNKAQLDKLGEDSGGNPTYNGNPIGGGGASDVFKNIVSAGTTFTASGDNDTFKINAGSNVTITALSSPDKGIQISAAGGGSSTGDMLMSDYDSTGDVKTAGGIKAFVSDEIGKLDGTVSGSAGAGNTLTAFSETDGKVSATFGAISITKSQVSDFPTLATVATSGSYNDLSSKPTIPTVTDTYSGTSSDGMSGKAVKSAIDALDGTISGSAGASKTLTAFSQTDGKVSATFGNISISKSQVSGLDEWHSSTATVSSGTVSFSGVDDSDNNAYELFVTVTSSSTNKNPSAQISSLSGEGTSSMSISFTTDADNGATCKLRIIK